MTTKLKETKLEAARAVVLKIKDNCKSPFIARDAVAEMTGGLVNPRTLSNFDSKGTGPAGRFYIGRRAAYPIDEFCEWLTQRVGLVPDATTGRGGNRP